MDQININSILRQIKTKLSNMILRCIVDSVDDTQKMQLVKILLPGGGVKNVERAQQYGFWSNPPKGAEGVVCFFGGDQDHAIILAVDDRRYNITGKETGEVVIGTDEGDKIHFKRGNKIEITCSGTVTVNCDAIKLGGASGTKKLATEDILNAIPAHTHICAAPGVASATAVFLVPLSTALHCTLKTEAK
jgi:phage baseplate assembly protein V